MYVLATLDRRLQDVMQKQIRWFEVRISYKIGGSDFLTAII